MDEEAVCAGGGDRGHGRCGFLAAAYCWRGRERRAAGTREDVLWRSENCALAKSPVEAETGFVPRNCSGAATRKARTSHAHAPRHMRTRGLLTDPKPVPVRGKSGIPKVGKSPLARDA